MLDSRTSNFAAQTDRASRWVNDKTATPAKKASINIFDIKDLTNLSTISNPNTLPPIDPKPIFLAVSALSENRSM